MMEEEKRKEAQKKLAEEERIRRLREGGESMKAELAMEESARSSQAGGGRSYLTPQEEQRREVLQAKGQAYRGYGESQQAEMAMWGKGQRGGEAMYEKGQETSDIRAAKEVPSKRLMTEEEMRRSGSDQVAYPAGGGSYYSETFERPTGTAGPESSFGRTERTPSGRKVGGPEMTEEEMRRSGSDRVDYPAGGGSYYSETFERPTGTAGPESSFGRTERIPSGHQYAGAGMSEQEIQQGRMGARPSPETAEPGKMGQVTGMAKEKGGMAVEKGKDYTTQAVAKGKEVSSTFVSKTKGVTSQITGKAKEFDESNRAEDIASRAGEGLGKAIRKTVSVAKEMTSGFRRGLGREEEMGREQAPSEGGARETVSREEYTKEAPGTEERHYQEVKKKENR